jgi:hypothetical protein
MKFFEFISKLDRRWVFVLVAIFVTIPFFIPLGLPIEITPSVKAIYDRVEALSKTQNPKPILISADFGPEALPELYPAMIAFMRHCFKNKIPIILMTLHPQGSGIIEEALGTVSKEYNVEKGKDYVFLGFGVGSGIMILKIGKDIKEAFPVDNYGNKTSELPLMKNVTNYSNIDFVLTYCGSAVFETWIGYARSKFNANVCACVTGTMATDAYPFLQSGQLIGLIGGLKGGAEYETLIGHRDQAYRGMDSQSAVHILIVLLVILGNIAFYATRAKKETSK